MMSFTFSRGGRVEIDEKYIGSYQKKIFTPVPPKTHPIAVNSNPIFIGLLYKKFTLETPK